MSAADGGAATNESWWREYGSRRQARLESPPTAAAQHQKLAGRWPSLLLLFFCLFFVSSLPATVRADVVCAHANSTCSDCAALCAVAQFFPLLPSPCHPEFPAITYDYGSSSFSFSGSPLSSPSDLLPTNLSNSFSLSIQFNRISANGTLLELETDSINVSIALVQGELSVILEGDTAMVNFTGILLDSAESRVVVTIENTSQNSLNVSIYVNDTLEDMSTASLTFPTSVLSANIGRDFTGSLNDVGIYVPALTEDDLDPRPAEFIPQCLCYPDSISTTNTSLCTGSINNNRYDESAHVVEFLFDNSSETYWQSAVGETPVTIQLQLSSLTNLSKIFISFESGLPTFATLEYMVDSQWKPLQYWADNCTSRGINESASTLQETICTTTQSGETTLRFLIAAGDRPISSSQEDAFETDQLRLTMDGLADGASHYAIREFEVCTAYCTDTSPTCDCMQSTNTISSGSPTEVVSTTNLVVTSSTTQPLTMSSVVVDNNVMTTSQTLSPTPAGTSLPVVESSANTELSSTITPSSEIIATSTAGDLQTSAVAQQVTSTPTSTTETPTLTPSSTMVGPQVSSSSELTATSTTETPTPSSTVVGPQVSSSSETIATSTTETPTPTPSSPVVGPQVSSSSETTATSVTETPTPSSTVVGPQVSSSSETIATSTTETPTPSSTVVGAQVSSSSETTATSTTETPTPSSTVVGPQVSSSSEPTVTSATETPTPSSTVVGSQVSSSSETTATSTTETPTPTPSSTVVGPQVSSSSETNTLATTTVLVQTSSSDVTVASPTPPTSSLQLQTTQTPTNAPSTTSADVATVTTPSVSSTSIDSVDMTSDSVPQPTTSLVPPEQSSEGVGSATTVASSQTLVGTTSTVAEIVPTPSQSSFSSVSDAVSTPAAAVSTSEPVIETSSFGLTSPTPVVESTSQVVALPSSSTTIDPSPTSTVEVAQPDSTSNTMLSSDIDSLLTTSLAASSSIAESTSNPTSTSIPFVESSSDAATFPTTSTLVTNTPAVSSEITTTTAQSSSQITTVVVPSSTVQIQLTTTLTETVETSTSLLPSVTSTEAMPSTSLSEQPALSSTIPTVLESSTVIATTSALSESVQMRTTTDVMGPVETSTVVPSPTPVATVSFIESSSQTETPEPTPLSSSPALIVGSSVSSMVLAGTVEISSQPVTSVEPTVSRSNTLVMTSSEVVETTSSVVAQVSSPTVAPTGVFTTSQVPIAESMSVQTTISSVPVETVAATTTIFMSSSSFSASAEPVLSTVTALPSPTVEPSTTFSLVPEESSVQMSTQDMTSSSFFASVSLEQSSVTTTTPTVTPTTSIGVETTATPSFSSSAILGSSTIAVVGATSSPGGSVVITSPITSQAVFTSFLLEPTSALSGTFTSTFSPSLEVTPTQQASSTSSMLLEPTPTTSLFQFPSTTTVASGVPSLTPSPTMSGSVFTFVSSSLLVQETPTSSVSVVVSEFTSSTAMDVLTPTTVVEVSLTSSVPVFTPAPSTTQVSLPPTPNATETVVFQTSTVLPVASTSSVESMQPTFEVSTTPFPTTIELVPTPTFSSSLASLSTEILVPSPTTAASSSSELFVFPSTSVMVSTTRAFITTVPTPTPSVSEEIFLTTSMAEATSFTVEPSSTVPTPTPSVSEEIFPTTSIAEVTSFTVEPSSTVPTPTPSVSEEIFPTTSIAEVTSFTVELSSTVPTPTPSVEIFLTTSMSEAVSFTLQPSSTFDTATPSFATPTVSSTTPIFMPSMTFGTSEISFIQTETVSIPFSIATSSLLFTTGLFPSSTVPSLATPTETSLVVETPQPTSSSIFIVESSMQSILGPFTSSSVFATIQPSISSSVGVSSSVSPTPSPSTSFEPVANTTMFVASSSLLEIFTQLPTISLSSEIFLQPTTTVLEPSSSFIFQMTSTLSLPVSSSLFTAQSPTITPSPTLEITPTSPSPTFSSEFSFFTPSVSTVTASESISSFEFIPPTSSLVGVTSSGVESTPIVTPTPTPSVLVSQSPLTTTPFVSEAITTFTEISSSFTVIEISPSMSFSIEPSSSIEISFVPETTSMLQTPEPTTPSSVRSSTTPIFSQPPSTTTLVPSATPVTTDIFPTFTTVVQAPDSSSVEFSSTVTTTVFPSPTFTVQTSSASIEASQTLFTSSPVVQPSSTSVIMLPESSSEVIEIPTSVFSSASLLTPSPVQSVDTLSFTSAVQPTTTSEASFSTSVLTTEASFSTSVLATITSVAFSSSSSMILLEPTTTLVMPSPTTLFTSVVPSSPVSTQVLSSSSIMALITTSVSLPVSVSMSPTPTPTPTPEPPRLPPLAPLILAVDGLGSPLQARPTRLNDSDGLHYEASIGEYIGITAEDTVGSVSVSFGEFSNSSEQYGKSPGTSVSMEVALASSEIWPDNPEILLAVQVRDNLLSTRNQEMVTAEVSLENESARNSCMPDSESGVCVITLPLDYDWFPASDDVTVDINVSHSLGNTTTVSATLKAVIVEDSSSDIFMKLPSHPVFPGDRINIPVYARYEYLLSSFSLICSVSSPDSTLEFSSTNTWSLVQSSSTNNMRKSVTGFRNYDTDNVNQTLEPDLLTNLLVDVDSVSSPVDLSVKCEAVDLLFNTKDRLTMSIYANATDRISVRSGQGLLFAHPKSVVRLFAHSSINELINIANLTDEPQPLDLSVLAFYNDGSLTQVMENLTCSSQNEDILKVENNCSQVFLDGSEMSSETKITFGSDIGEIPFRVSLPTDTYIEVENDTLNKIDTTWCSDNSTLYQTTHVHVVATISSSDQPVYITSRILPYLETDDSNIITINQTTGEILASGAGEAEICLKSRKISCRQVTVSDANPVSVLYLDTFVFSDIQVSLIGGNVTPTAVDIRLLQDFTYVNSEVRVVGVAVFSDGSRRVLDPQTAIITTNTNGILPENQHGRYLITRTVNEIEFEVEWNVLGCVIDEHQSITYFNSSTPLSLNVSADSSTVTHEEDPARFAGTPYAVNLTVLLVYEDREEDVTLNSNIDIQVSQDLIMIQDGVISTNGSSRNGSASITVNFENEQGETSIMVVEAVNLNVQAYPFPRSGNNQLQTIKKIGSSFQQVEIEVKVINSNHEEHIVPFNQLNIMSSGEDNWLEGNILSISNDNPLSSITISVEFDSLTDDSLSLTVDDNQLLVQNLSNLTIVPSGLNKFQIRVGITFEGGVYHYDTIPVSEYQSLLTFTPDIPNVISINDTGFIDVMSNSHELIEVCARNNSVQDCANFSANLEPGSGEIDLGADTGLPLESVGMDDEVTVPVFLNLDDSDVGIFEMEVTFNNNLLEFSDLSQGGDWEGGQIVYVHPASNENHVSFGGILHAGARGSRLHLADVTFITNGTGTADFSANVSFIAMNDVNTTLLSNTAERVSQSSRVSLTITGSNRRRREADESSLSLTQGHGIRRRRQEAGSPECLQNSVVGDTNGDCVVDLRDVYRLQLYVAESVLNFTSPLGQQLLQQDLNVNTLDLDGDGVLTLTDILELEIVTLNLAYEVNDFNATVVYNTTVDSCVVEVSGLIKSLSDEEPPAEAQVHLIIEFLSTDREFANVFRNMTFTPEIRKSDPFEHPYYYGGKVIMDVAQASRAMNFTIYGTVESISITFNTSAAVVVTDDQMNEIYFFTEVSDFEAANDLLNLRAPSPGITPGQKQLDDMCVPPATSLIGMSSTSTAQSPASSSTSQLLTSTTTLSGETTSITSSSTSQTSIVVPTSPPSPSSPGETPSITSSSTSQTSIVVPTSPPSPSTPGETPSITSSSTSQIPVIVPTSSPSPSEPGETTSVTSSSDSSMTPTPSPSVGTPPATTDTSTAISSTQGPSLNPSSVSSQTTTSSREPDSSSGLQTSTTTSLLEQTSSVTDSSSKTVPSESSSSEPATSNSDTVPSTSLPPTNTGSTDDASQGSSNSAAAVIGGVLGAIIVVLIGALLGIIVVRFAKRKKGHYLVDQNSGVHIRRNSMISNGSSDFWRETENGIEMSPLHSNIDIVPLEHYGSMVETNIDVVANHNIIMSDDPYGSTSLKPLIPNGNSPERGPPKKGSGPAPLGSRPMPTASYAETGTVHTGATTMVGYTSSSMERSTDYDEDEDEGQLVLPDYDASQAYLSLGLTPLSQLSPDAHTSTDFGFFPSMPPPVAPSTSSIFSTTTSNSSLAMDNPFSLHSGGGGTSGIIDSSMMPDAIPERRSRRNKYDATPLSQGFPLKLEPVMESPPNSQFSGKQNGFSTSDESSKGSPSLSMDPAPQFMFPSAVPSQEFSRLSQGRTALRVKRPGAKGSSRENLSAISPKKPTAQGGGYGSLGTSRHMGRFKPPHSPTKKRRPTRDLRQQEEPEESMQPWQHNQKMYSRESPEPDPHYPLANGFNSHEIRNGHRSPPLRDEAPFNSMEMMKRPSSRTRKISSTSNGSNTSQKEESSPHKWTPRHTHHASLDDSPVKSSYRAERSDSARLYTTYEHR